MAHIDDLKVVANSGMDFNSAPEFVAKDYHLLAFNFRVTGTQQGEEGNGSNPESTQLITQSLPAGICKGLGISAFEDIGLAVFARYSSAGFNQIVVYNQITKTEQVIYEDLTDSGNIPLFPLNPQNYLKFILINETYLLWVATGLEVGYTNLKTLMSGGYGTVLAEDLSLLKPQCMIPPIGVYGSDLGQAANYLYGKLPQYIVQYVNVDFNYSAWSTRSKRIVPYQQNTPILGSNVGQNNYIIVSVNIGSVRATTFNIGRQFDDSGIFSTIKSVDRAYAVALPNMSVNVSQQVFEAYDPATNLYSFTDYNNTIAVPIAPTETDLAYDYVPLSANAIGNINGNLIALGDLQVGYVRPTTPIIIKAVGYNPNIAIPSGTYANPLVDAGHTDQPYAISTHKRILTISLSGVPHTGDTVVIVTADTRSATSTRDYSYVVPSAQDGNLAAVVTSISAIVGGSFGLSGSVYTIIWVGDPYYGLLIYSVELFFAGAGVANSIPTNLDNAPYQAALAYFDGKARYFPIETNNTFIGSLPSYAQVNGNAINLTWQILTAQAPVGAVGYQWLITKPPVLKVLDTIATLLVYKGTWDASTNTSPALSVNSGNIGDTYQITTPATPEFPSTYHNIGDGSAYPTGDYVTNVGGSSGGAGSGQYYVVLPKTFGNIATTGTNSILAFSLNSLALLNAEFGEQGVTTNLVYDFTEGDRCTLHYWIDGSGNINYFNSPCINLSVLGYDVATNIVKVENSSALIFSSGHILYNGNQIDARNIFMRLYSPAQQNLTASATLNETVWYEIGERFSITNGVHNTLTGILYDGGAYYKTRQFPDAIQPYANPPIKVLATDLNYSDFYTSPYHSFGRVRAYNDELEQTERKAITITSQTYILGSKKNGLTRFYPADVYGETDGQTSSSFGAIQNFWQRGDIFVIIQQLNVFYAPVNIAYVQLNAELTQEAISEKLINNGRYATEGKGNGLAKEAFCYDGNTGWMLDPHYSEIFELTGDGILSISVKMSKYFKTVFALAYSQGKKIVLFYNRYYKELMVCIETEGGILTLFPFATNTWNPFNNYVIAPGDVTATPNGSHSTASYDSGTGLVTYTPAANYVGADSATFTFLVDGNPITVKNCLNWIAGNTTVNAFYFTPKINQPLSTSEQSNNITVSGPNIAVPISITGGAGLGYSINSGAFTSAPGTVNTGDIVQVQVNSSASNSTLTSCTLTISGTSATFNVTTLASGGTTTPMSILSEIITGAVKTTFGLGIALSIDITISYNITYVDGGVSYFLGGGSVTILAGATIGFDTITYGGSFAAWSTITCTLDLGSPSPNPAGGTTIIYSSPHTDPA